MKEHIAGRPGAERNVSRARNHNVIRDRYGFVISDYIPDMPHRPLSDLRGKLAEMLDSGKYDNPRLDFLAYGEPYPKEINGSIETVKHGIDDGVSHITTSNKVV